MLELSGYPIIDSHCHAFLYEKEDRTFPEYFSMSTLQPAWKHNADTLTFQKAMRELARMLGCKPEPEAVTECRDREYGADQSGYTRRLFDHAGIKTLLVDTGYPCEEFTGYSVPLDGFEGFTGTQVRPIFRIDPLLATLFKEELSFDQLLTRFRDAVSQAVLKSKCVALKSVIAYVFGIEVQLVAEAEARSAYERSRQRRLLTIPVTEKAGADLPDEKKVRDFLLADALLTSAELHVPFQIHTGVGDSPFIDVRAANPLHLLSVIADRRLGRAEVVLVHAGYPYIREAGFLANNYPNVYVDVSEMIPYTGQPQSVLSELLEMAPVTKVMYGSDGANIPEIFWLAAIWAKEALAQVLSGLVEGHVIDERYAQHAASRILSENAKNLYRL